SRPRLRAPGMAGVGVKLPKNDLRTSSWLPPGALGPRYRIPDDADPEASCCSSLLFLASSTVALYIVCFAGIVFCAVDVDDSVAVAAGKSKLPLTGLTGLCCRLLDLSP